MPYINAYIIVILCPKVVIRKNKLFRRADLQKMFDSQHYELFNRREKVPLITFFA